MENIGWLRLTSNASSTLDLNATSNPAYLASPKSDRFPNGMMNKN